jgi:hypothetical protein
VCCSCVRAVSDYEGISQKLCSVCSIVSEMRQQQLLHRGFCLPGKITVIEELVGERVTRLVD